MNEPFSLVWFLSGCACGAAAIVLALIAFFVVHPWIRARFTGCPVSFLWVVGMRVRGTPPGMVIDAYIALSLLKAEVSIVDVERAYLSNRHSVKDADQLKGIVLQEIEK